MKANYLLPTLAGLLLTGAGIQTRAQDAPSVPRHVVALQTGIVQHLVRDQNASPLIYRGHLAQLRLSYQLRTARGQWFIGLSAARGDFYSRDYPERVVYYGTSAVSLRDQLLTGELHVHHLRRLTSFAGGEVLLGAGLQQSLYYPQSEPFAGMASISSVPLLGQLRYALGPKTTLEAQVQYALAGLITRLPYDNSLSRPEETSQLKAFYRNNTRFEGGHRLQQAGLRLTAAFQLGRRWQAGGGYAFGLLRHPDPKPMTRITHSVHAQLHFAL